MGNALGVAKEIGGAVLKGVESSGGPVGSVARALHTGGNGISKIKTNLTKWKTPSAPKKSHFKKRSPNLYKNSGKMMKVKKSGS